ncbi:peptidase S24/S26A/S26B/S26C, partial [Aspergillus ambiguus]|uniref:putative mitochondrial inner membrane protease subunit Imp2 n=1 Tax=Aspergillus ambiguus TaxID=176160 RepID=UPI003CCCA649
MPSSSAKGGNTLRSTVSPESAKSRSSTSFNSTSSSSASSQSHPSTQSSRRPFFQFATFRARYAALPLPIRSSMRALRLLAPIIPIGLFFSEHVLQVMWVRGPSMTPYLNEDYEEMHTKSDMVLVNMWPWGGSGWPWERKRRLERGMIVTFRSPANPSHVAIKRVVGLPGDRITTREPCMKSSQIVPFNHVWLEGDAKDPKRSLDSNTYGPVSLSLITGRVMAVLWPRWRWLQWEDWEKGVVEGDIEGRLGEDYRSDVRQRVLKEAVKIERPVF